jgi:hypothetical protein
MDGLCEGWHKNKRSVNGDEWEKRMEEENMCRLHLGDDDDDELINLFFLLHFTCLLNRLYWS